MTFKLKSLVEIMMTGGKTRPSSGNIKCKYPEAAWLVKNKNAAAGVAGV